MGARIKSASSMSARRSRANRSSVRLSESRSARRMNSASVSGVNGLRVLQLVVELERHLDPVGPGRERHPLRPAQLLVLDLERLADRAS